MVSTNTFKVGNRILHLLPKRHLIVLSQHINARTMCEICFKVNNKTPNSVSVIDKTSNLYFRG